MGREVVPHMTALCNRNLQHAPQPLFSSFPQSPDSYNPNGNFPPSGSHSPSLFRYLYLPLPLIPSALTTVESLIASPLFVPLSLRPLLCIRSGNCSPPAPCLTCLIFTPCLDVLILTPLPSLHTQPINCSIAPSSSLPATTRSSI